jgi:carbon monoxide dehydrogenase subunit G
LKMSDEVMIPAPRKRVWAGLNDPEVLRKCIPGCESINRKSPTSMDAVVTLKLGPMKARFAGSVTLSELKPPVSYRISGKGQGGIAGFASGGAFVRLEEIGTSQTLLKYDVDAQVGGKLASLGARMIESTSRSLAQRFFDGFANLMGQPETEAPKAAVPKAASAKAAAPKKAKKARKAKKAAAKAAAPKKASKKASPKKAAPKKAAKKAKKSARKKK